RLVQTPEWSSTLGVEYKVHAGTGTVTLNGQAQYQSRVFFTPFGDDRLSQDPVTRFDLSARYEPEDKHWFASIWGRNITDELVATTKFVIASGRFICGQYTPPRTYGATIGYNF